MQSLWEEWKPLYAPLCTHEPRCHVSVSGDRVMQWGATVFFVVSTHWHQFTLWDYTHNSHCDEVFDDLGAARAALYDALGRAFPCGALAQDYTDETWRRFCVEEPQAALLVEPTLTLDNMDRLDATFRCGAHTMRVSLDLRAPPDATHVESHFILLVYNRVLETRHGNWLDLAHSGRAVDLLHAHFRRRDAVATGGEQK